MISVKVISEQNKQAYGRNIEKLPERLCLPTSTDIQGLVAQGRTPPNHKGDMPEGKLRTIQKQAGISAEEFLSVK